MSKCMATHWTAQIRWPLSTFFFPPPLWGTTSLPGVIKRPERDGRLRTPSTPLRYVSWYGADWHGQLNRCHTFAMTNVIKYSSSRRQFHGPVEAALIHVNRRRQTDGLDKVHRRLSDCANAPKNVIKTQMVTMWSRHTIPNSTLPFL
jgi:hypothetical protein